MKILVIIPARMGSSRFPGKPLKKIQSKPMIEHVYRNVSKNKLINNTIVATCDNEIKSFIESIGGTVVMTSNKHERASDRCAEAVTKFEKINNINFDIVVMVQGDEPMVHPDMISEAINPMIRDPKILVTNLLGKIKNSEEFEDPNCIKVVTNINSEALFFSRRPIPYQEQLDLKSVGKQVCIIPFKKNFLIKYSRMKPTPLEILESVDMLRILENGFKIKMVKTKYDTCPVDTQEDLIKVENLIKISLNSL